MHSANNEVPESIKRRLGGGHEVQMKGKDGGGSMRDTMTRATVEQVTH